MPLIGIHSAPVFCTPQKSLCPSLDIMSPIWTRAVAAAVADVIVTICFHKSSLDASKGQTTVRMDEDLHYECPTELVHTAFTKLTWTCTNCCLFQLYLREVMLPQFPSYPPHSGGVM